MSDGSTEVVEDVTPSPEPEQVEAAQDDAMYEAAMAELDGGGSDPDLSPPEPDPLEQPEVVASAPEVVVEPDQPTVNRVDADTEYVFTDKDGNDYTVKGADAIYQTSQYHRKMQELDTQHRDYTTKYEDLESRFSHDKGGLARDILKQADAAERLATVRELLAESGLSELSGQVEQSMARANLQHDPNQAQQAMLQQQRESLTQQQHQFQAQQALHNDIGQLETKIGRKLSAREMSGVDNVFGSWVNARQANPNLQRPSFDSAYKMAIDAIRFEDGARTPAPQPQTPVERARSVSKPAGPPSDEELLQNAYKEQGWL